MAIAWGFGAALVITILPLSESSEEIGKVLGGMKEWILCQREEAGENEAVAKELDESDSTPEAPVEEAVDIMEEDA